MPQKIYRAIQTAIVFTDSGGDYTLTLQNLPLDSGRLSAQVDRGTGSKPVRYKWKSVIQWTTNPVAKDYVEIMFGESGGVLDPDANLGTADVAVAVGDAPNLCRIGLVKTQSIIGNVNNIASGVVTILDRYFQVGVFNRSTTMGLRDTANTSRVIFTPMPDEIQT